MKRFIIIILFYGKRSSLKIASYAVKRFSQSGTLQGRIEQKTIKSECMGVL